MTSLDLVLIRSDILQSHFGQIRSSNVATLLMARGSTATNSATGDYLAVLDPLGQKEEPAGKNGERTKKSLYLFSKIDLISALTLHACKHDFSIFSVTYFTIIDEVLIISF